MLQLGFEQVSYEVNEGSGTLHDTVHIVKLNNVTLQMSYTLMVEVVHSTGTYPAILGSFSNNVNLIQHVIFHD